MEKKPFRRALHASREELRMVAMDTKECADQGTSYENAMRLYAKATFWATLALSAPETDAEPSPEEDTPVPVADVSGQAQELLRTITYRGVEYDLSRAYKDNDGDVWTFTDVRNGEPLMTSDVMPQHKRLYDVVDNWGPMRLVGLRCPTCDHAARDTDV